MFTKQDLIELAQAGVSVSVSIDGAGKQRERVSRDTESQEMPAIVREYFERFPERKKLPKGCGSIQAGTFDPAALAAWMEANGEAPIAEVEIDLPEELETI